MERKRFVMKKNSITLKTKQARRNGEARMYRLYMLKNANALAEWDEVDKLLLGKLKHNTITEALYISSMLDDLARIEKKHGVYKPVNRVDEMQKDKNNQYSVQSMTTDEFKKWFDNKCQETAEFMEINKDHAKHILEDAYLNFVINYHYNDIGVDKQLRKIDLEQVINNKTS
jgi:hypothetical protein